MKVSTSRTVLVEVATAKSAVGLEAIATGAEAETGLREIEGVASLVVPIVRASGAIAEAVIELTASTSLVLPQLVYHYRSSISLIKFINMQLFFNV